jgi:hypothetical protein
MKNKLILSLLLCIASLSASEKIYIDDDQLEYKSNCFHIHQGHNVWLETKSVHRDSTGLFSLEVNILRCKDLTSEYKKTWKCPYCFMYWHLGSPCKNPDCPSRFK